MNLKKEISGVKDMVSDFAPKLASTVLNPTNWQSTESMGAALGVVASGFVGGRIKKLFDEIFADGDNIEKSVLDSDKTNQAFISLVKFASQENPENETWEAAKKIFKRTLKNNVSEQERDALYDMLDIVTALSGSEVRILSASYKISLNLTSENKDSRSVEWWANNIAERIHFSSKEQVLRYEDNLVNQKLIGARAMYQGQPENMWNAGDGSTGSRLTKLGSELAKLLSE